jgi:hypothetical protein
MSLFKPYITHYLLLDAARMLSEMDTAQEMNTDFVSLYKGGPEQHLSSVAPYLFACNNHEKFENWIAENVGKSWGIFVTCNADMEDMCYHFRKFLKVKTEDLQQLYFRFYDPRVLRIFLPTCDRKQIVEFFGPVQAFICEQDEEGHFKRYTHNKGELIIEEIAKKKIIKELYIEPQKIITPIETTPETTNTTNTKGRKWL